MDLNGFIREYEDNKKGLYDLLANNYYKLGKEDLKEIALNAIYVANDDDKIISELKDRL